ARPHADAVHEYEWHRHRAIQEATRRGYRALDMIGPRERALGLHVSVAARKVPVRISSECRKRSHRMLMSFHGAQPRGCVFGSDESCPVRGRLGQEELV